MKRSKVTDYAALSPKKMNEVTTLVYWAGIIDVFPLKKYSFATISVYQ